MTCFAQDSLISKIFTLFGTIVLVLLILKFLYSLWKGLYTCFLGPFLGRTVDLRKMGKWAVVTGCTDGIGKAYAFELAKRGLDIVLISRSLDKLKDTAQEIERKFKVNTKIITADFAKGLEPYDAIRKELEGLEIGVLVNNVGMSYTYAEYFVKVPEGDEFMEKLLRTNITSVTMMMRIVLPQMEQRKLGVIINLASISALHPIPLLSVYGASKAYVHYLSRAVHAEYKKKGIIIQSVLPAFVATKMSKIRHASWDVPTPEDYVKWAISTVGIEDSTFGHPAHKFKAYCQELMALLLPTSLQLSIMFNIMNNIRLRYYKKFNLSDKND